MLHATFSTFGFVEKIATFDKGMGFQALVQYNNPQLAQAAKTAMDGRPIPQYLAPHMLPMPLRVNFSSHNDVTVKFQGHKSRCEAAPFPPIGLCVLIQSYQVIMLTIFNIKIHDFANLC